MGGRYYPVQTPITLLSAVTLESTYADARAKTIEVGNMAEMTLYVNYTMGATETSNTIEIKVEQGQDSSTLTDLYQLTTAATSSGVITLSRGEYTYTGVDAASSKIAIPITIMDRVVKVSFKETGVASNKGTITAKVLLGGK